MGGKERLYICACEASVFSCRIMTIMRIQKKSHKRPPQQFLLNMHRRPPLVQSTVGQGVGCLMGGVKLAGWDSRLPHPACLRRILFSLSFLSLSLHPAAQSSPVSVRQVPEIGSSHV